MDYRVIPPVVALALVALALLPIVALMVLS